MSNRVTVNGKATIPISSGCCAQIIIKPATLSKAVDTLLSCVPDEVLHTVEIHISPANDTIGYMGRYSPWEYSKEANIHLTRGLTAQEEEQKRKAQEESVKFEKMVACPEPTKSNLCAKLFDTTLWTGRNK